MNSISMKDVIAVIMAGGRGTRLHPLTQKRSKPAVPFGGKYRLIDIPISNCINSGIHRISVLTQFNSASLHRHIASTYNQLLGGSLQILAANQTTECVDWYLGTADAMRKQLAEIQNEGCDYTLILAGDHVYRMDYQELIDFHASTNADITVAVHAVSAQEAGRFGLVKRQADGRLVDFVEKPADEETLEQFRSWNGGSEPFFASMGIYLFNTKALIRILEENPHYMDFGCDLLPEAVHYEAVYGYEFKDYWQDIGTIRSYYESSMDLTDPGSLFDLSSTNFPLYSNPQPLPSSMVIDSELTNVVLAEGCRIRNAKIARSVIGSLSRIGAGSRIRDSVIMGIEACTGSLDPAAISLGIGENCSIEGAIIDKNVRMGRDVTISSFPRGVELDGGNWFVCDGIVVIPKDTVIPNGTVIAPEKSTVNFFSIQKSISEPAVIARKPRIHEFHLNGR